MGTLLVEEITRQQGEFNNGEYVGRHQYLACYLDDILFCYVHLNYLPGTDVALVHLTHKRFGAQVLKAMREAVAVVKGYIRQNGYGRMVGLVDGEKVRNWARLMHLIGLDPWQLPDGYQKVSEDV